MPNDLFNTDPDKGKQTTDNSSSSDVLLDQFKTESGDRKYKTIEDALKALAHSQNHIQTLEQEAKESRDKITQLGAKVQESETIDNFLKRYEEQSSNKQDTTVSPTNEKGVSLKEEDIISLVRNQLDQDSAKKVAQQNIDRVQSTLLEQAENDPAKVTTLISEVSKQLNTTPDALKDLASRNPDIVLRLFNTKGTKNSDVDTEVNSMNMDNQSDPLASIPKNLLTGGHSSKTMQEAWNLVKAKTYKDLGVETS